MMNRDPIFIQEKILTKEPEFLSQTPEKILQKFGLSTNQSKIYLCLCKMGSKTASQLSKQLEIPRTETYHILKTLQSKGCVLIIHNKPLKYEAVSFEDFLEKIINLEVNKIKKLQSTLEMIKKLKISNNKIDFKQIC